MDSACLFQHRGKCVGVQDFKRALETLGVHEGDTLLVHAGLQAFGKLGLGYNREGLCGAIVDVIKESVGTSGALVMPTFTYAFCKGTTFDRDKSPSEVGTLSEYFRTEKGVVRSLHPIFSVAAYGAKAQRLTDVDSDSFGPNSFFARLREAHGKILFMGGATFANASTFLHHIEQMHAVPYRFMKTFQGEIIDGEKRYETAATFFVRPLDGSVENDAAVLEKRLREKKLLNDASVGAALLTAISADDLFREGMQLLDEDIEALLKAPLKKKH